MKKELDLKQIWKSAQRAGDPQKKYTMKEIMLYRQRQSSETTRGILWGIKFDMFLKAMLLLGFVILLILLPGDPVVRFVSLGMVGVTLGLIFTEFHFIRQLDQLGDSAAILDSLRQKIDYLRSYYRPFIFIGALTTPILMLCGFFFYYYFKYGEIRMGGPGEDWPLYFLLFIGYLVGILSAYPFYRQRRRMLSECLRDLDDEDLAAQTIAEQQYRRRRFVIISIIGVVLGLLFLLLMLLR